MISIGIDIGTTKLCAVVVDVQSGKVIETLTEKNTFIPSEDAAARRQDPASIWSILSDFFKTLLGRYPTPVGIGITGQMHGILYLDAQGEAVSDLYTWQDKTADHDLPDEALSYAQALEQASGYPSPAGFGATTYYAHVRQKLVPSGAVSLCCIGDYIALKLTGRPRPLLHSSNAASLGLFDTATLAFDTEAIQKAGLDPTFFPEVTTGYTAVGNTAKGIPVCVCIGDNQASFAGSVSDARNSIFVNVGTGSQISVATPHIHGGNGLLEVRPYVDGLYLYSGSALCGGSAFALLESFYRSVLKMTGLDSNSPLYDAMLRSLDSPSPDEPPLQVSTRFSGTRMDPAVRGAISGIGIDNFTPTSLTRGFLQGMVEELHSMYLQMKNGHQHTRLVAAGNGVRKTPPLQRLLAETFGVPLQLPLHLEEAAYGAALFSTVCVGLHPTLATAQSMMQYIDIV